jgi:hypothetical protein
MTDGMTLTPIGGEDRTKFLARANEVTDGPYHLGVAWIRQRGWTVVPVESGGHFNESDPDAARLADAMRSAGCRECYAVAVEPVGPPPPADVALVQATPDGLLDFSYECAHFNFLLMPDKLAFAVLCTVGDYYLVAGPTGFVRQAVGGDIERARNEFKEFATGWSEEERLLAVARRYESLEVTDS